MADKELKSTFSSRIFASNYFCLTITVFSKESFPADAYITFLLSCHFGTQAVILAGVRQTGTAHCCKGNIQRTPSLDPQDPFPKWRLSGNDQKNEPTILLPSGVHH